MRSDRKRRGFWQSRTGTGLAFLYFLFAIGIVIDGETCLNEMCRLVETLAVVPTGWAFLAIFDVLKVVPDTAHSTGHWAFLGLSIAGNDLIVYFLGCTIGLGGQSLLDTRRVKPVRAAVRETPAAAPPAEPQAAAPPLFEGPPKRD